MTAFWLFSFSLLAFWKATGAAGMDPVSSLAPWPAGISLGAAILLGARAFEACRVPAVPLARAVPPGIVLLAAALVCPFPACVPPALLAAGILLASATDRAAPRALARGCLAAGLLLTLEAPFAAFLPSILCRRHEVPILGAAVGGLLALLGMDVHSAGGWDAGFTAAGPEGVLAYTARLENLLIPSFSLLCVAGIAGRAMSGRARAGAQLRWIAGLFGYALLRFAAVAAAHIETGNRDLFLSPTVQLASLLPLVLFLAWLDRDRTLGTPRLWGGGRDPRPSEALDAGRDRTPTGPDPGRRHGMPPGRAAGAVAAGGALLLLALAGPDPGVAKGGRILIDEAHGNWESAQEPLDTRTYGIRTVYTYRTMTDFLRLHFPAVEVNTGPLARQRLEPFDVLILKTPTTPYAPEEARAVLDFVREGGGLWLVGDHTNVFGMGTYLNAISEPAGIRFLPDATADLSHGGRQLYEPPRWFAHPIPFWMEPMLFATSDSLAIGGPVRAALVGKNLYLDDPDFSVLNFFGDFSLRPHKPYGLFVQGAARRYGRGRIAVFTDSTLFSNFSFHFPGVWQLALGTVQWLNRRSLSPWAGILCAALGLLLAGAGVRALRGLAPGRRALLLGTALWAGTAAGSLSHDRLVRTFYPLPAPREPLPVVAFPLEGAGYRLPLDHETHSWDPDNYHTFFVATQRLGLVPRAFPRLREALGSPAVVLADREAPFSDADLSRLRRYVEAGGRLLVMDRPGGGPPPPPLGDPERYHPSKPIPAADLLSRFGFSFGEAQPEQAFRPSEPDPAFPGIRLASPLAVAGGTPALVSESGVPVLAWKRAGRGRVAVFGGSRAFAVARMGQPTDVPNPLQLDLYRLEYWVFERVLELGKR